MSSQNFNVRSTLSASEKAIKSGNFKTAINILDDNMSTDIIGDELWSSLFSVKRIRALVKIGDIQSAEIHLAKISKRIREINPQIDFNCHAIEGFLLKRLGHKHAKNGERENALLKYNQAIESFSQGRYSAHCYDNSVGVYQCIQNIAYTNGLKRQLKNSSADEVLECIKAILDNQYLINEELSEKNNGSLVGIVMAADLASKASITPNDVITAARSLEYNASIEFDIDAATTWPAIILKNALKSKVNQLDRHNGIMFGAGVIISEFKNNKKDNYNIVYKYLLHLMDSALTIEASNEFKDLPQKAKKMCADLAQVTNSTPITRRHFR
jgi:hypothetical protein